MTYPLVTKAPNWDGVATDTKVEINDALGIATFQFPLDVYFDTRSHLFHVIRGALALALQRQPIDLHICYAALMRQVEVQVVRDLHANMFYHDPMFCFRHTVDAANQDRTLTLHRFVATSTYFRKRDPDVRRPRPLDQ